MKAPLYLTRPGAQTCVAVPAEVTEQLATHHIESVRFMYRFYRKNVNVVLNTERGMNEPLQISAFLSAVKLFPALVVCSDTDKLQWQKTLETSVDFKILVISSPPEAHFEPGQVTLVPHSLLRRSGCLKGIRWSLFVVDDIDTVINLAIIRNLQANFRICITRNNFVSNPDQKLRQQILEWVKRNQPTSAANLVPYPENWLWLTWRQYGDERSMEAEIQNVDRSSPIY